MKAPMRDVDSFLRELVTWACGRDDVLAAGLVGSYARGGARADSDVDIVMLVHDPDVYLAHRDWITELGEVSSVEHEDWGRLQSLRVLYGDGLEVEFGLARPDWAATDPLDPGTERVICDGIRVLLDRHGVLAALLGAVGARDTSRAAD